MIYKFYMKLIYCWRSIIIGAFLFVVWSVGERVGVSVWLWVSGRTAQVRVGELVCCYAGDVFEFACD